MRKTFGLLCTLIAAAAASMIVYYFSAEYTPESIPAVVTLSDEQLGKLGHADVIGQDGANSDNDTSYTTEKTEEIVTETSPTDVSKDIAETAAETVSVSDAKTETETEISVSVPESSVVFPIDINLASEEELTSISGIGPATAENIISYRNEHGFFGSVDELINVSGIGEKKLAALRGYVYVSEEFAEKKTETETVSETVPESEGNVIFPIDLNTASKEELMQISGIGEVTADAIYEYAHTKGFDDVSELMEIKGIGEKKFEKIKPYVYVEKSEN